jgi:hypothetical protein
MNFDVGSVSRLAAALAGSEVKDFALEGCLDFESAATANSSADEIITKGLWLNQSVEQVSLRGNTLRNVHFITALLRKKRAVL